MHRHYENTHTHAIHMILLDVIYHRTDTALSNYKGHTLCYYGLVTTDLGKHKETNTQTTQHDNTGCTNTNMPMHAQLSKNVICDTCFKMYTTPTY